MSAPSKQSDQRDDGADAQAANNPRAEGGAAPGKRGLYTMTAQEGLDVAELVKAAFARKSVGKLLPRRLEVVAPDGPSTGGGKHARQTIRLTPLQGNGAPLMCGYLDPARKHVELRAYEAVAQQFEERFHRAIDVTQAEYEEVLRELENALVMFRYTFAREAPLTRSAQLKLEAPAEEPINPRMLNVALVCGVFVIAALVAAAMLWQ